MNYKLVLIFILGLLLLVYRLPSDDVKGTPSGPSPEFFKQAVPEKVLPTKSLAKPSTDKFDSVDGEVSYDKLVPIPVVILPNGKELDMSDDYWALVANVYFESTNQNFQSKLIQVESVISRKELLYSTLPIYKVVTHNKPSTDKWQLLNNCHYSWYCDGSAVKRIGSDPKSQNAWLEAQYAVKYNLAAYKAGKLKHRYTHYLTTKVEKTTWWVKYMKPETRKVYQDHAFYMHDQKAFDARWASIKAKKTQS